jgi:hypothetical protein
MTGVERRCIVIVDGYSTGRELLRELLALNVECLHLSSEAQYAKRDYEAGLYDADLGYLGQATAVEEVLWPMAPTNVAPGSEKGIELAARLSAALGLPTNDLDRIPDRRIALAALRHIRQPAPLSSVWRSRHFIVNTVSRDSRRHVTGAWRVLYLPKSLGRGVGALVLLDPASHRARELIRCALAELSRLGIENGAGHNLIKWTRDGPVSLGAAACLMDIAMDQSPYSAAGMLTQAGVYASVLARPEESGDSFKGATYRPARHMAKLLFGVRQTGQIEGLAGLDRLKLLASYFGHYRRPELGATVEASNGWKPQGGVVYLVHDDLRQLVADMIRFRRWERQGALYQIGDLQ